MFLMGGLTNIADFLNAGNTLRDRAKYLRYGTFTWLGSGSNGFTGVLVGYAPATYGAVAASGSYGIDGGAAQTVYGMGAVAVNRWCIGSVQINGGIGWGVAFPAASSVLSNVEVTRAVDRMHKDGTLGTTSYVFTHAATSGGFPPVAIGNLLAHNTSGICTHAGLMATSNVDPYDRFSWLLDFVFDGVGRFTIGIQDGAMRFDKPYHGCTAAFGFIPFASSMSVGMRYALGSDTITLNASATWVTGA